MSTINTNLTAITVGSSTQKAVDSISKSMERLSTGVRINSASDDAAGIQITNRMTAAIRGMTMAVRNVQDGISLLQTTDGALDQIVHSLQRMRELALQAVNGTNTKADRDNIGLELREHVNQINHIAETTKFNGIALLNGSNESISIHIDESSGGNLNLNCFKSDAKSLGIHSGYSVDSVTEVITPDSVEVLNKSKTITLGFTADPYPANTKIEVGNVTVNLPAGSNGSDVASAVESALLASGDYSNYIIKRNSNTLLMVAPISISSIELVSKYDMGGVNIDMTTNAPSGVVGGVNFGVNPWGDYIQGGFNKTLGFTGGEYSNGGSITIGTVVVQMPTFDSSISNSSGYWNQKMAEAAKAALASDAQYQGLIVEQKDNTLIVSSPTPNSLPDMTFVNTSNSLLNMTVDAPSGVINGIDYGVNPWSDFLGSVVTTGGRVITKSSAYYSSVVSLENVNLDSVDSCNKSLSVIDASLEMINLFRSTVGAYQNRLDSIINGLYESIQNTSASKSRIVDTDYATETSLLAKNQIINQAATAMLAQANQYGRNVLALLK
jgi:flagellin